MLPLTAPETVGINSQRLQRAFEHLRSWLDHGIATAIASVVVRHGKVAGSFYGGTLTPNSPASPVTSESLFHLASIGKPMTALAVMRLVEAGQISLEDPVMAILPDFAGNAHDSITVRHLLTHTSGLPQDPDLTGLPAGATTAEELPSYLKAPLAVPVGSKVEYSNVGYGILGLIVEAISGQTFPQYMREQLFEPIGMQRAYLAPPAECYAKIVHVAGTNEPGSRFERFNSDFARQQTHPAGHVIGSAQDVARFFQLFLADGQLDQRQIIAPATAQLMRTNQTAGLAGGIEGFMTWDSCAWGLGFDLRGVKQPHFSGEYSSAATFGHTGVAGTFAWADPSRDLICVMLANRMLYNRWNTPHWSRYSTAVIAALDE